MKSEAEHSELLELTVKKLSGEASAGELDQLQGLIDEKVENKTFYEELEKTWLSSGKAKGITQAETDAEWLKLRKEMNQKKGKSSFQVWLRIAATVLLALSVSLVIFQLSKSDQVTLVADETITHTLSDGSTVTLKAGSKLNYTEGFSEESRNVTLEGEAYFEVSRNPERPFFVYTSSIDVSVLGTSFNVRADKSATAEVVVTSGLVAVNYQDQEVKLNPGEKALFVQGSEKLTMLNNDNPNYLSWMSRDFSFDNTPLKQVVKDLNHAFQGTIQLDDNVANCQVTVTFEDQSLESILKVLQATLNLSMKEKNGKKVLSGPGC